MIGARLKHRTRSAPSGERREDWLSPESRYTTPRQLFSAVKVFSSTMARDREVNRVAARTPGAANLFLGRAQRRT